MPNLHNLPGQAALPDLSLLLLTTGAIVQVCAMFIDPTESGWRVDAQSYHPFHPIHLLSCLHHALLIFV